MNSNTTENKIGFLKNDKLLVCSMFIFYGLCIVGLIAGAFVWLGQRNREVSANATSTAQVVATQQANATATVIIRATEQAQYKYIESFDKDSGRWYTGSVNDEYGKFTVSIKNGVYIWDLTDANNNTLGQDFYLDNNIKDFDAYVDSKFVKADSGIACSGLVFRKSPLGWDDGAYVASLCTDRHFEINYYQSTGWQNITYTKYEDAIHLTDWNRLEVHAKGNHLTFYINNKMIFETTDNRREEGIVSLYIQADDNKPTVIWFDNFGLQPR